MTVAGGTVGGGVGGVRRRRGVRGRRGRRGVAGRQRQEVEGAGWQLGRKVCCRRDFLPSLQLLLGWGRI